MEPRRRHAIARRLPRWAVTSLLRHRERRAIRSADLVVLSFHRCGRTWLRLLLGRYLQLVHGLPEAEILDLTRPRRWRRGLPHILFHHDDNPQWKPPQEVQRDKGQWAPHRILLLVRDPRDVVVSSYFHKNRRLRAYRGTLSDYLHEPRGSFDSLLAFYNAWWDQHTVPRNFAYLRYEDLHDRGAEVLAGVLLWAGEEDVDSNAAAEAIAWGGIANVQALERGDFFGTPTLRPGDPQDPDSYKARRGVVGGYERDLSPHQIADLESRMASRLHADFGYQPHLPGGAAAPPRRL